MGVDRGAYGLRLAATARASGDVPGDLPGSGHPGRCTSF